MPCYPWGSVPQGDKATTMDEILQKFLDKAPVAVIVGATIARTIGDSTLDDIFERHAGAQYTRNLTFSALSRLMTQVVFCTYPSVNAAYFYSRRYLTFLCFFFQVLSCETLATLFRWMW